jgi:hypothetical protein
MQLKLLKGVKILKNIATVTWDDPVKRFELITKAYETKDEVLQSKLSEVIENPDDFKDFCYFIKNHKEYGLNIKSKAFKDFDEKRFRYMADNKTKLFYPEKLVLYYYFKEES